MPARRLSTPPPRSEPPPAVVVEGERGSSPQADGQAAASPSQTLWTAPSPTQTLGHSSPELPPLPSLPSLGGLPRTPLAAANRPVDDTSYYTASWGSPYQRPPPGFEEKSTRHNRDTLTEGSEELDDDESPRFGLDHLIPNRLEDSGSPKLQFGLDHLLPRLPFLRPSTPTKSGKTWPSDLAAEKTPRPSGPASKQTPPLFFPREPTEDWIRRFLTGQWQSENANWWSDGSTEEETDEASLGATAQEGQTEVKEKKRKKPKGHKSRQNNLTLKQQDFWAHFGQKGKETFEKMMASRFADTPPFLAEGETEAEVIFDADAKSASSHMDSEKPSTDKPLPPPPSSDRPAAKAASPVSQGLAPPSRAPEPAKAAMRLKKRVLWKNRNIVIQIPMDPLRGKEGGPPRPLSLEEVNARMRQFEESGLNIRGSDSGEEDGTASTKLSQNREIFPNAEQERQQWQATKECRIHIPDKNEWDRYVSFLLEQKLAALGVSTGDEETDNPMSRSTSAQYPGLAFSPPPQSTSVGSQGLGAFSAPFSLPSGPSPGIPGHMARTSIASPISPYGNTRPTMHLHRHSTFTSPSNLPPQQPTPPVIQGFSPQLFIGQNGGIRGGSPAPNSRPDLHEMLSPVSPFSKPAQQYPFPQTNDVFAQMQQQQQQQLLQQQQQQKQLNARPPSTLEELPEEDGEEELRPQTPPRRNTGPSPNIVVPTPRGGHHHNISQNLEREIRDAEYHLEQAIDRQLDEDGEFGSGNRYGLQSPPSKPTLTNGNETTWQGPNGMHQQQPHGSTHSLSQQQNFGGTGYHAQQSEMSPHEDDDAKTTMSDVETNPSIDGQNDQSTGVSSSQHTFGSSQFNNSNHASHSSHGSATSKLNVQAKEFKFNPGASFTPGNFTFGQNFQPQPAQTVQPAPPPSRGRLHAAVPSFVPSFKLGGLGVPAVPSTTFDFSSQGPAFKTAVPMLQPGIVPILPSNGPPKENSGKLFNIDFQDQDIIKPARRSKAIPIIQPDPNQQQPQTDEETIDESGRPAQAEGGRKKHRRGGENGDDVPQFATPHVLPSNAPPQPLSDATHSQNGSRVEQKSSVSPISEGKENRVPDVHSRLTSPFKPNFPTQREVIKSNQREYAASGEDTDAQGHDRKAHSSKGSLNVNAKPFEFRPGAFNFGVHVTRPSTDTHEVDEAGAGLRNSTRSPAVSNTYQPSEGGSFMTALETGKNLTYPESEFEERPTFHEIDDVMKAMNDQGSEFGVIRESPPWARSTPPVRQQPELRPSANLFRSPAPSPAPHHRLYASIPPDSTSAQDPFSDSKAGIAYESPVHKLNDQADVPVSDWDDIISSDEEIKVQSRSRFFDNHVDGIIDSVLQSRLGPLERNIHMIKDSISALSLKRIGRTLQRSMSAEPPDSDADDEDDDLASNHRNRSPGKNRKLERIKNAVVEALTQYQPPPLPQPAISPGLDATEFYGALADLKVSIARSAATGQIDDFREIMEEALNRQSVVLVQRKQAEANAEAEARIADLERTLEEARERLEVTIESRKVAENAEHDAQRRLALTEEELSLLRDQAHDDAHKVRAMSEEVHETKLRLSSSESSQEELRRRLVTLETQNEALEATLDEYRLSSKKWHDEINQANVDNEQLRRSISTLEGQNQESIRGREKMRHKFDQLQKDMVSAATQVADEKARWQKQEEEHVKKFETLRARIEAEARTRERLEREMERLEMQEREGMRLKVTLEQTQRHNSGMEEAINKLRLESLEYQKRAERFEREFHESREAARAEIKRTRVLMEADLESANNQVNIVRAELESENNRLRTEIDNLRMDRDTEKARQELLLESEADAKRDALREAHEGRDRALKEQQHRYEKAMEDQQQRYEKSMEDQQSRYEKEIESQQHRFAQKLEDQQQRYEKTIEDLHRQHNHDLANTIDDKQHSEAHLNDRLALATEKVDYLQDKVIHLEEKLEVTKSAAHAAALAAQSTKAPAMASTESLQPSAAEKVSPRALRESIAVLQEQLQEREERIEQLEQKLGEFDSDAPGKLKEKETEIGWLRELLGVRVDDLSDLINALSQPAFDREAVRDAAIRIRTNLQMEQQEKERLINGGQSFPALTSISNFASPKAAQLAAAIGNWRKGRDNTGSKLSRSSSSENHDQTPSKTNTSASGFLSGLMTPPASHLRKTPTPKSTVIPQGQSFSSGRLPATSALQQQKQPMMNEPTTPPRGGLLHKGAYDQDAEDSTFSPNGFYAEDESFHERMGGGVAMGSDEHDLDYMRARPFEPFGPDMRS